MTPHLLTNNLSCCQVYLILTILAPSPLKDVTTRKLFRLNDPIRLVHTKFWVVIKHMNLDSQRLIIVERASNMVLCFHPRFLMRDFTCASLHIKGRRSLSTFTIILWRFLALPDTHTSGPSLITMSWVEYNVGVSWVEYKYSKYSNSRDRVLKTQKLK